MILTAGKLLVRNSLMSRHNPLQSYGYEEPFIKYPKFFWSYTVLTFEICCLARYLEHAWGFSKVSILSNIEQSKRWPLSSHVDPLGAYFRVQNWVPGRPTPIGPATPQTDLFSVNSSETLASRWFEQGNYGTLSMIEHVQSWCFSRQRMQIQTLWYLCQMYQYPGQFLLHLLAWIQRWWKHVYRWVANCGLRNRRCSPIFSQISTNVLFLRLQPPVWTTRSVVMYLGVTFAGVCLDFVVMAWINA